MDIYHELGVPAFINARAPYTRFGGAVMPPPVVEAMVTASRFGTLMVELQEKAGQAIARLTRNEAAYVSCGAASGIALVMAACMAGTDPERSERLPDTTGMKNQVVMHACDRGTECDAAVRCSGAAVVTIGDAAGASEDQLAGALGERTAAVVALVGDHPRKTPLDRIVARASERGVPVILDGAAAVPPKENLWKFTRDGGVDAVIVSGGKGLRGPQATGLVLGRQWVIDGCAYHGVPNIRFGRGMKVGKEEMAGIYAAVKLFMEHDEGAVHAARVSQADYIVAHTADLAGIVVQRVGPTRVDFRFDAASLGMSYADAYEWFLRTEPAILLGHANHGLGLNTTPLQEGDEQIIAEKLRRFFLHGSALPA
jgi:uncharacterized pyridoxal phosphate-dependent enzyme